MQDLTTFLSNHMVLTSTALALFILLIIVEFIRNKRNTQQITPAQAIQKINRDNAIVIDIRPLENFKKGHITDALCLTSDDLKSGSKKLEKYKTKPIIVVCQAGIESQKIATSLLKQGYNVYSLTGGIRGWQAADMPLVKE